MTVLRDLLASCVANTTILEGQVQECQHLVGNLLMDGEVHTGTLGGVTGLLLFISVVRLVTLAHDDRPPTFILDRYLNIPINKAALAAYMFPVIEREKNLF